MTGWDALRENIFSAARWEKLKEILPQRRKGAKKRRKDFRPFASNILTNSAAGAQNVRITEGSHRS
jgi:hypothetical protein